MIEDDSSYDDILDSILVIQSLLKKADLFIIRQHMDHCVKEVFIQEKRGQKIGEVINLLEKMVGK